MADFYAARRGIIPPLPWLTFSPAFSPLDAAAIRKTVAKTRRAVIVDEGWRSGSLAAEVMARIAEDGFWELDAPLARVCSEEVPIPYPRHLEQAAIPQVDKIVAAAVKVMGRDG